MSEYDIPFWIQVGVGAISVFFALLAIFQSKRYNKSAKEYSQKIDSALNDMDSTIKDAVIDHMAKANECTREAIQAFNKQSTIITTGNHDIAGVLVQINEESRKLLSAIDLFQELIFWDGSVFVGDWNGPPKEYGIFSINVYQKTNLINLNLANIDDIVDSRKGGNKKCVLSQLGRDILKYIRSKKSDNLINIVEDSYKLLRKINDNELIKTVIKFKNENIFQLVNRNHLYRYLGESNRLTNAHCKFSETDIANNELFELLNGNDTNLDRHLKIMFDERLVQLTRTYKISFNTLNRLSINITGNQLVWVYENKDRAKEIIALQS